MEFRMVVWSRECIFKRECDASTTCVCVYLLEMNVDLRSCVISKCIGVGSSRLELLFAILGHHS